MAKKGRRKTPQRWSQVQSRTLYKFGQRVVDIFLRAYVGRYRFLGADNVPATGGAFLIANHESGMDPIILGAAIPHRIMRGPGKIELFQNPVFAYFMRRIGMFPLRSGEADASAVRAMVELYRSGGLVAVYPEGARTDDGEMRVFNPGFARLVIKLKATVIPAGMSGVREFLPVHARLPRPRSPMAVVVGECFELSEYYGQELTPAVLEEAAHVLFGRVAALVAQARRERETLTRR